MKVCFFGVGSIGTRHILNLRKICIEKEIPLEIHAFRSGTVDFHYIEIEAHIGKNIYDTNELDDDYDVVFVTNPTSLHFETIRLMSSRCGNFFVEKPIFHNLEHSLADLNIKNLNAIYVAAPMQYTDVFRGIKEICSGSEIYSVRAICSSYMPDWQKGRNYSDSFRTKSDLGGGVDIDLIHEMDYIVRLFGMPKSVLCKAGHYSKLNMNTCDLAIYVLEYEGFIIELHLDYFGKYDKREIEIYTEHEVIVGDYFKKEIRYLKENKSIQFDKNKDHYLEEMRAFINWVKGEGENTNTIKNAYDILALAKGKLFK